MVDPTDTILVDRHEDKGSVTLILSGGEILEIAAESLPEGLPPVGERISASLVSRLREAAARKQIARRLFQLLDRRLYSTSALLSKLQQEGYSTRSVEEVLASFAAAGLHSDTHYATAYCRDTLRRRPVGPHYLRAKLRRQGVNPVIVGKVLLDLLPPTREVDLARRASRERWRKLPTADTPGAEAKVYRFLLGRGFRPAVARQAARTEADMAGGVDGEDKE